MVILLAVGQIGLLVLMLQTVVAAAAAATIVKRSAVMNRMAADTVASNATAEAGEK